MPLAEGPAAAEDMSRILVNLGYRPVAIVHKQRRIYRLQRQSFALEVCLDDVAEVGQFVEVEILAALRNARLRRKECCKRRRPSWA